MCIQHNPLSQKHNLEKIRQHYDNSDFITVYRLGEGYPHYGHFVLCGLLPGTLVNEMLSDKSYISEIIENVRVKPDIPPDAQAYNRWGSEGDQHGFEPLVILRKCDLPNSNDYVEISEEFRLFHDLHHDRKTDTYLNPMGEVIVKIAAIDDGYEVKVRRAEIQSYLDAKQMYLSLFFQFNLYSVDTLETLGLKASKKFQSDGLICWKSHYRDASSFSDFASNHFIRGRRFFSPTTY